MLPRGGQLGISWLLITRLAPPFLISIFKEQLNLNFHIPNQMNIGINPLLLNSIGLLFDIFGAWLIAIEIFYQFKGKTHQEPTIYCNGTFEQNETP